MWCPAWLTCRLVLGCCLKASNQAISHNLIAVLKAGRFGSVDPSVFISKWHLEPKLGFGPTGVACPTLWQARACQSCTGFIEIGHISMGTNWVPVPSQAARLLFGLGYTIQRGDLAGIPGKEWRAFHPEDEDGQLALLD